MSEAGYEVTAVSNGDEALDAVRRRTPEVVITDLNMPGRSVSQIIRELRHNHPGIRIVILSGLMDDLMSQAVMASGVDAAIDKSMAAELLVDTVRRLLNTGPSFSHAPLNRASLASARR